MCIRDRTTTTVNLAAGLAKVGQRVLMIDLDPQGNATSGVGEEQPRRERTSYALLAGDTGLDAVTTATRWAAKRRHLGGIDLGGVAVAAVLVLPLVDEGDRGVRRGRVEFGAVGAGKACHVARVFDGGHLHAQGNAQVGELVRAGVLRRADLALDAALAKAMTSGEAEAIYKKWFTQPIPPKGLNLNVPIDAKLKNEFAKPSDSADPDSYK